MSTPPSGLLAAFWRYEAALLSDDRAALADLVSDDPDTLHADGDGVLVGHEAVVDHHARRQGAPTRTVIGTRVHTIDDDHAHVLAETRLHRGGIAIHSQLWERSEDRWRIVADHVSSNEASFDHRVWRVVGDPLVRSTGAGPLTGRTVAVKDVYAVAGHLTGAGNPAWTAHSPQATEHAWAVGALLARGATLTGITRCDEFAYGLSGDNAHYGTPPNPRAPGRVSGGSSSGSASAVSLGQVSIGLGSDTAGSIRVPAAYQGLWGIRTTHDAVPRDGMVPLAPSFDAVGWLTRDPMTLLTTGRVLLPSSEHTDAATRLTLVDDLLDACSPEVSEAVRQFAKTHDAAEIRWAADLDAWRETFVARQQVEAWATHSAWLADRMDTLGSNVRRRFELAAERTADDAESTLDELADTRASIRSLVGDEVLILPAAPTVAPTFAEDTDDLRRETLTITVVASLGGLPAVTVPLVTSDGLPCGATLVAAPGRDLALLELAVALDRVR